MKPDPVLVHVVADEAGFEALAPAWNGLHEVAPGASIFNSWPWLFRWWQAYGAGRSLRILVASEGGAAIGILPLYLDAVSRLGIRLRLLRTIGTGGDTHPDDLNPLLAPGKESAVAHALAEAALQMKGPDVVHVTDFDAAAAFGGDLQAQAGARRLAFRLEVAQRIKLARLPATWEAFLERLPASRRTRLKKHRRKLEAAARARFFVWEDPATLDRAVDRLAELHRARWAAIGGSGSFATREYVDFHRKAMADCLARGWLRLYCLELDGAIAAITYCYRFRNRVFVMQAGFDPGHARLHPGGVLLGYAIEHAISEGNEAVDFLRGDHSYKDSLSTHERETLSATIVRDTAGALAWRASSHWLPAVRRRLRGAARSLANALPARSAAHSREH